MEWWLSDPTGLSSSAPGAGMPNVGLQCFLDAPLPVSGQLHRRQGGLGTRTQGHWGLPLALGLHWPSRPQHAAGLGPAPTHHVLHAQLGSIEQQQLHGFVAAVPHSLVQRCVAFLQREGVTLLPRLCFRPLLRELGSVGLVRGGCASGLAQGQGPWVEPPEHPPYPGRRCGRRTR